MVTRKNLYANRRRNYGKKVQDIINESGNKELDRVYREIKMVLESIKHQNETNDLLIKQQLVFTNRMLNIINPKREKGTYNSYGRL